jgi:hypothetical protein
VTTYPQGEVSRYGRQLIAQGIDPQITLVAPGREHTFYLSGPLAPMPGCQAGAVITKGVQGLHPAFNHLDYRGARQDGVTWADTVYDPAEMILDIEVSGRTAAEQRQVTRDLISALDPKRQSTLSWFTPEFGEWWCKTRLFRAPGDVMTQSSARHRRFPMKLSLRNDDAFWRSTDSTSSFGFSYEAAFDSFDRADSFNLGADWTQTYSGPGGGALGIAGGTAFWYESGALERTCRAIHDSVSDTDYQVITIQVARINEFPFPNSGYIDLIGRVSADGNSYVRFSLSGQNISLSSYVDGVLVWHVTRPLVVAPLWNETFSFVIGTSANTPRQFRVLRRGFDIFTATEPGNSRMGAAYRGWGFVMSAGAGFFSQISPVALHYWSAGDNNSVSQSGHLPMTNRGTEEVYPKYLCYGPGTFYIGNGTGSVGAANPVVFGPLNPGQIALVDTDPRRRGVIDLSPGVAPGPVSLQDQFGNALAALAIAGNILPLIGVFSSMFGILPVQGPLYSRLFGRFTRPISGHVDGTPLVTEQVAITITGGTADSKIVGTITPLRRWPE